MARKSDTCFAGGYSYQIPRTLDSSEFTYGCRRYEEISESREQDDFRHFMSQLKKLDASTHDLLHLMKRVGSATARRLVKNKYFRKDFWREDKAAYERESETAWKNLVESLDKENSELKNVPGTNVCPNQPLLHAVF